MHKAGSCMALYVGPRSTKRFVALVSSRSACFGQPRLQRHKKSQWSVKPWRPDKTGNSFWDQHNRWEISFWSKLKSGHLLSNTGRWWNLTRYICSEADARARKWLHSADQLWPARFVYNDATERAQIQQLKAFGSWTDVMFGVLK